MYTFLIQVVDSEIIFDFAFHLKEAIKYQNWFWGKIEYKYIFCENLENISISTQDVEKYIPIGSVEFVLEFYKKHYGIKNVEPINIPKQLNTYEFLQRKTFKGNEKNKIQSQPSEKYFIKDISKFKKMTDIVSFENIPENENILVSELIDITGEWRGFVYRKQLLDMRCYLGDFTIFPDFKKVEKMIEGYTNSYTAYTIDVATLSNGETALIEIHPFFSCGLYGFFDYKVLVDMFISTHKEILNLNQ